LHGKPFSHTISITHSNEDSNYHNESGDHNESSGVGNSDTLSIHYQSDKYTNDADAKAAAMPPRKGRYQLSLYILD
jgi:hypothetical protein